MTFNPGDTYIASSNQSLYALYAPIALQLTHNEMPGVVVSRFGTNYNVDLPENMEVVNLKEIFNYSDEATWEITGSSDIVIDGHIVTLHSAWGNITLIGTYQGETITYFINLNNPYILTRYTLTFEGVANPVYVKEGQTIAPTDIPDLPECYDEDYIAASWDFDFSTPIYSDQYINYTIDQKYKHVKYYVDGELVYTSEELTYGDPTTPIDRTAFTKDHYYTELWNTKPDFTGANVAYDFNFDAEYQALYLEFRPIEYSVYFNNSAGSTKLDGTPPPTLYYTIESSTSELTLP